jgi:hypothetical protein
MTTGMPEPPDDSIPEVARSAQARRQQELLEREDDVVQHLTVAKLGPLPARRQAGQDRAGVARGTAPAAYPPVQLSSGVGGR